MPQEWYETVDDYALSLFQANIAAGTRGLPGLLARFGLSQPIGLGIVVAANTIALTALVAKDPAGLRSKGGGGAARKIAADPELRGELITVAQEAMEFIGNQVGQGAMVKDEQGQIEIL